jgi:hypothetical protein
MTVRGTVHCMRTGFSVFLLVGAWGCGAHVTPAPPVPSRTIGSCTLEVLSLPPSTPYVVLGQGYSDNMSEPSVAALFEKGCALGADGFVAPLPPESFVNDGHGSPRLVGTFIRRCPAAGCPASQAAR